MFEFINSLPLWFVMIIITIIVLAFIYRFVKYGLRIKAGPVEIDADNDTPEDNKAIDNVNNEVKRNED